MMTSARVTPGVNAITATASPAPRTRLLMLTMIPNRTARRGQVRTARRLGVRPIGASSDLARAPDASDGDMSPGTCAHERRAPPVNRPAARSCASAPAAPSARLDAGAEVFAGVDREHASIVLPPRLTTSSAPSAVCAIPLGSVSSPLAP